MRFFHLAILLGAIINVSNALQPGLKGACRTGNFSTVAVDWRRYAGSWYELARSASFRWDRGCRCTTAEYYAAKDDAEGQLRVLNTCRKPQADGAVVQRLARATVLSPGRLKVNFFLGVPLADADYRVVYVDEEYAHAVVVSCSRLGGSLIWVLSRTPAVSKEIYEKLVSIADKMGFDTGDLQRSPQDGCWSYRDPAGVEAVERRTLSAAGPRTFLYAFYPV